MPPLMNEITNATTTPTRLIPEKVISKLYTFEGSGLGKRFNFATVEKESIPHKSNEIVRRSSHRFPQGHLPHQSVDQHG